MKREYLGWIVALIVVAAGAAAKVPTVDVGRYQISWGTRTLVGSNDGAPMDWREALLLDTVTGKTWFANPAVGNTSVWVPFGPLPATP